MSSSLGQNDPEPFSSELKEWFRTSKTHGFDRFVSSGSIILRLIWIVCFFVSAGVCAWLVVRVVMQYYKYEVITKIRDKYVYILTCPVITICNKNPMVTPDAQQYLKDELQRAFNLSDISYSDLVKFEGNQTIWSKTDYIQYLTYAPDFNNTLRRSFGYDMSYAQPCLTPTGDCNSTTDFVK